MIVQLVAKENNQENSHSKRHSENRSTKVRVQNLLLNLFVFLNLIVRDLLSTDCSKRKQP